MGKLCLMYMFPKLVEEELLKLMLYILINMEYMLLNLRITMALFMETISMINGLSITEKQEMAQKTSFTSIALLNKIRLI